ncbi:MAG: DUF1592 domain-containing protein [Archangium sp.]|nr:DUF1592 domain-containing protein [Archangium sp.]
MRRLSFPLFAFVAVGTLGCEGVLGSSDWQPGMPVPESLPPRADEPVIRMPEEDVCAPAAKDVGRVTIRRLNRFEYDSTVRDLLGDTTRPSQDFPADDFGHGYDNQGDVLSTAPLLVEKYDAAATKLVQTALAAEYRPGFSQRLPATGMTASTGSASGQAWNLYSNGTLLGDVTVTTAGTYTLNVRAWEQAAGPDRAQMRLLVDGAAQGATFNVAATAAAPQTYTRQVTLTAGTHRIGAEFLNDYYQAPDDRNLFIEYVEVTRPASGMSGGTARILVCDPATGATCVRTILQTFARKAWRRPIQTVELTRLEALVTLAQTEGDGVQLGLELALSAVLLSPNFLFRVEGDVSTTPRALDDYELAARLSYFLWGSMPDDELSQLADTGTLKPQLAAQVTRMLADPKSDALATQFAGSWLWSRAVPDTNPDPTLFPAVNASLKAAMQEQTTATFRTFFREDRSALELLTGDDTFLNDALATHYGLPLPGTNTLTRVRNVPLNRRGLLGHGGVLTVTSNPNRTSPVKRGKWVMSQLLCMEPPPPPANVEAFETQPNPTGTLRQQFEAHRSKPECAGCHAMMDPIGFGLESYDAVGRFRTTDTGGFPIDSSGELFDGRRFNGPTELAGVLAADPKFGECMAQQVFTYALGRAPVKTDRCTVKQMSDAFAQSGGKLPALISSLITSDTFTQRRGESP